MVLASFPGLTKNKRMIRLMKPNSEVLRRIQTDFWSMIRSRSNDGYPDLEVTCFYEELGVPRIGMVCKSKPLLLMVELTWHADCFQRLCDLTWLS
jgi:hypothetical protein